jgi:glutathione S-transferase/translation elongation factor EF-1beta
MKIYTNRVDHYFTWYCLIAAKFVQANVEVVIVSEEQQQAPEFKAKKAHGKFPMLETDDGHIIFESNAIADYIARTSASHGPELVGRTAFEEASIQQWMLLNSTQLIPSAIQILYNTLGWKWDQEGYNQACTAAKAQAKMLNTHLEGKTWLVGGRMTLADVSCFIGMIAAFQLIFDPGFRKAMPNVSAWWERVSQQSCVISVVGRFRMCEKAMKAQDATKLPAVQPKEAVEEKKEEAPKAAPKKTEDDDDFDPFADDDDGETLEEQQARFDKVAAEAKAKKGNKPGPIAKSLVVWDVKPWGEETDLDAMAREILKIEQDGLFWKTEYKKEPVAFGIEMIRIGATIEDEKVSSDDVQEKIEALEDYVQSVDIFTFQKI